ncbi:hypothetical protein D1007_11461 [Hordeum vulgare]|uniref:Predicted protein n=1 Tax=Hordeum vulgare subsp. vulgare TaxID=112509 RepID=F2EG43_HORVV|nr:uncharacterized protein LOC123424808 [Hordeum vulgare subsp. vulgare]KAE8811672.1 hypothetical protein D1007_11461 [Hordeum vulgare]BAK06315.1 predicted protein [Hordeum vulgare subsp. vulgare]
MAVPDAVPASPPPAARIVVVMLALVRFARVLRVAAGALTYLCLAVACISSGAAAALLVARRAWGKGSGPFLFLQALMYGGVKVCLYSVLASFALAVLLLCVQRVAYLMAVASGSTSVFEKSAFGSIKREPVAGLFRLPRAAVLGLVVDAAFFLLTVAGLLVAMMSPHVEGSIFQGQLVASVIMEVGIFGMLATACFVTIPALILHSWRQDQAEWKARPQCC